MPSRDDLGLAGLGQFGEHGLDLLGVERAEQAVERAHEILPPRRHQHAERRERARHLRDDDLRNENLRARSRPHAAARRRRRRSSRSRADRRPSSPTPRAPRATSRRRRSARCRAPPPSTPSRVGPQSFCSMARSDGLHVELHRAVEEALGVDAAEHEVGVGHHRIGRALAVGRPGPDRRPRSSARHGCRRSDRTRRSSRRPRRSRRCRPPAICIGWPLASPPIT